MALVRAASFDGSTQYGSLAARNLLKADNAIAYASVGDWTANGTDTAVAQALRDLEISGVGRIPTAIRGAPTDASVFAVVPAVLTNAAYTVSAYIWPATTTETFRIAPTGFTDNTAGSYISCPAGEWTRIHLTNWTPGADASGSLQIESENTVVQSVDITGVMAEQSASLGAFDANALLSPGDQDFWFSSWVYGDDIANGPDFQSIFRRWIGGAVGFEVLLTARGAGGSPAEFDFRVTHDGTTQKVITTTGDKATSQEWHHVFAYHRSGVGTGLIINGDSPQTSVHTTGVWQSSQTSYISFFSGAEWDGRLGSIMTGTAAHGWDSADPTPAELATFLYNSGIGRPYSELKSTDISDIGLVEDWDLGLSLTGLHSGIVMTNNGTIVPGDAIGPGARVPANIALSRRRRRHGR